MIYCKFCNREAKSKLSNTLHERLCLDNPNKVVHHITGTTSWRKGLTLADPRIASERAKAKITCDAIGWHGFGSMDYNGSQKHKESSSRGGGYRENAGRSKKFKVLDSFGKETTLQSTYELRCSLILDDMGIKWIRPKALKYDNRNYFADFYLVEHDIYLDPKNDYKAKCDQEKIRSVIEQNNVKLFILLESQLTSEYISWVVQR